jgi:cytochrome c oxidase cbb3-type subunit 3
MSKSHTDIAEHSTDRAMGHADEADGIEEYDNDLPTWWLWLFYATIAIAVWVWVDWHVVSPKSQESLYAEELAIAAAVYPDMTPVDVVIDEETVAAGAALYAANCVACHMADGTGGIGPSLVDSEWLHGGSPDEIRNTIFYGVEGRGMIGWAPLLGIQEVSYLAAYVHGLGGGQ